MGACLGWLVVSCGNGRDEPRLSPSQEESDAFNRAAFAEDLSVVLEGPESVEPGGSLEVTATVTDLDSGQANGTTVVFELDGAIVSSLPTGCGEVDGGVSCLVPYHSDPGLAGEVSADTGPVSVALPLTVEPTSGSVLVQATVTSDRNDLDNDPDPSNNTATLDIDVEGEGSPPTTAAASVGSTTTLIDPTLSTAEGASGESGG